MNAGADFYCILSYSLAKCFLDFYITKDNGIEASGVCLVLNSALNSDSIQDSTQWMYWSQWRLFFFFLLFLRIQSESPQTNVVR